MSNPMEDKLKEACQKAAAAIDVVLTHNAQAPASDFEEVIYEHVAPRFQMSKFDDRLVELRNLTAELKKISAQGERLSRADRALFDLCVLMDAGGTPSNWKRMREIIAEATRPQ